MLDRWPQLAEVSFDAQNRLWDVGAESPEDPRVKTIRDPRPPFGHIGLVLRARRTDAPRRGLSAVQMRRSLGSVRPGISVDAVSPMRTAPIRS